MNKPLDSNGTKDYKMDRPIMNGNEVNVIALFRAIWENRGIVIYSIAIAVAIGILVAIFSPVKYKSSATILPQAEGKTDLGGLGGLAGMAGINLGSMMGNTTGIQPELYPQIINSYPFLNELVHQPFNFEDELQPLSIYEKQMNDSVPGFGAIIKKYTIRLPWTLKNALFSREGATAIAIEDTSMFNVVTLTREEASIIGSVSNVVTVEVDSKNGLVSISVEMGEPLLTAQVTQKTVELLQEYIIEYKTRQARENLDFIEARFQDKKNEFELARTAFFNFRDRNQNVIEERTDVRYQELNDSYNIASEVYQNLAKQREQAQIAVKKDTPAFSIIEPVKVPIEKSAPRRKMILIGFVFFGGFVGIGIIFGRIIFGKLKKAW